MALNNPISSTIGCIDKSTNADFPFVIGNYINVSENKVDVTEYPPYNGISLSLILP